MPVFPGEKVQAYHMTPNLIGIDEIQTGAKTTLLRQKVLGEAMQLLLPGIATHVRMVLSLSADLNTSAQELSRALLRDYALSLTLLRQAHSAFFAVERKEIISMRHIVVLLGLDNVTKIVLSCPRIPVEGQRAREFRNSPLGYLVARSVLAGNVAWHLAPIWDEDSERLAMCSMLFCLGEVALAAVCPRAFKLLWELRSAPRNMERLSKKMTGWKPDDLGMELARKWDLPTVIRQAVALKARNVTKLDPTDSYVLRVSFHVNNLLYYAGLPQRSFRKQSSVWNDLKCLAKTEEKRLSSLFQRGVVDFKEKNPFLSGILWDQGLLPNLLV